MKVSDLVANKISKITNHIFSGQGGFVIHILDSLSKKKNLKIIPSQNEQGASLAADAYYRTSGKLGVVVVTSGPGVINALQGMACSYYDSIPALYIIGAPVTKALKKNKKLRQLGFQEMEVKEIVSSFTKYSTRITNPKDVSYEIDKCIYISKNGRPGPCLIDFPDDIQRMDVNLSEQRKFHFSKKKKLSITNKINQVLKIIEKSKKPIFIIGNGVKISKSINQIKKILKKTKIPYSPTWATMDCFDKNDKYNIGSFGVYAPRYGNFLIQSSDLLVILGSRLSATLIGGDPKLFAPKAKKIQVDIDSAELNEENGVRVNLKIKSDLKDFINLLEKKKIKWNKNIRWFDKISKIKKKYPILLNTYYKNTDKVNPYVFFKKLSELTTKKDIIIPDASANLVWTYQAYSPSKNQKVFTSLNHSPMGYSVAAAVGASMGSKNSQIIAIIGDGSMQMNIQEIENIKHFHLPIKVFIINNNGYGMIKQTINRNQKS
jgi:acetolactate synthase-1/2/3 large subunit